MATKKKSVPLPDTGIDWSNPVGEFEPVNPKPVEADEPEVEKRGAMATMADTALSLGRGAVQGVRMLSDVSGADNTGSGGLRSVEDFLGSLQSAQAKGDQQEIARIMQEAEGLGVLDQVKAGLRAFAVAPGQMAAQALGTAVPTILAAAIPGVGPAAVAARMVAPLAIGVAQGVGTIKASVYDEVKQNAIQQGATPEEAEARAVEAQSYGGPNSGQIALGGVLGAVAGKFGIEGTMSKLVGGAKGAVPGLPARVGMGAVSEALPEFAQGGQEKVATNMALTNDGTPTDPWSGVVAGGTMEAAAGGVLGGALGIPRPSMADEIRATKLTATGPLTKGLNAAIETHAETVESSVADAVTLTRRQQTAPIVDQLRSLPPEQQDEALQMLAVADNMQAPGSVRRRAQNRLDFLFASVAPPADSAVDPETGEIAPITDAVATEAQAFTEAPADPGAAVAQREADRPEPAVTPRQDGDILTGSGNPFKNMTAAMRALGRAGDGFELARVDGGLVVRKSVSAVESTREAATPSLTTRPQPTTTGAAAIDARPTGTRGTGAADVMPRAAADLAGDPIDSESTAFKPESGTRNIPRSEIPQIQAVHRGAMVNFLGARGITHETVEIPAGDLKPTQAEFSPAKVQKAKDFTDTDRSILVSSDGHVLDGHHQWLARLDNNEPVKAIRLDAPIADLITTVREFPSAGQADGATTAQPTGTLQEQWQDAVKRGDTESAAKINDQIVAEKNARKEVAPADDTNPTSGTRTEAQAPADQAPAPARSDAAAPASVPAAGGATTVEAGGVGGAGGWEADVRAAAAKRAGLPERIPLKGVRVDKKDSTVLGLQGSAWYVTNEAGVAISTGYASKAAAQRQADSMTTENPAWTAVGREIDRLLENKPGTTSSAAPERVKVMTRFGQNVYVDKTDLDSAKPRMRHFTSTGKSLGVIVRENLDPTGEARAADAKEQADNPLSNIIGTKDGKPFASEAAAARERSMRGLGETHDIVPMAGGFALKRNAAPTRTKSRSVPAAKAAAARVAKLADYFAPGNVVKSYGGHDRVVSFHPATEAEPRWAAVVHSVIKKDGQWVDDPNAKGNRQHSTEPSEKELKAGPVARVTAEVTAPEIQPSESKQESLGPTTAPESAAPNPLAPKSFRKNQMVETSVFDQESGKFVRQSVDAETALQALKADLNELKAFRKCITGG